VQLFHGTDFAVPYLARHPSVMTVHDLSPWLGGDGGAERVRRRTPVLLRLGLATMVITPTEAIRRAVIDRFRISADRVAAVPLAAARHFRPVPRTASRAPYFLYAGTLEARKNIARIMEAWREVRRSTPVDLVLAGRARQNFAVPPDEPGLRVLGEVAEGELPALYSDALACVYPSLYEGFGLPALEAMQCGAVTIVSRDPAIQEVASDAAIPVDAQDTRALAEAMLAVARAPERFAALRERAIQRASQFSWTKTARLTREVYDAAGRIFGK
jgi:glycosyltransferase involved in cell wall biosynthesis